MIRELNQIKQIRQKIGLTQSELAKLTGVSQSVITKIERGKITPSYQIAKNIFETLEKELHKNQKAVLAKEVSSKKIITIESNQTIKDAIKIMEKRAISQIPVTKGKMFIGSISEETIVKNFENIKSKDMMIKEIMDEPFPTMPEKTPLKLIFEILKIYSAVVLTRNEKIVSIITKADLIKKI